MLSILPKAHFRTRFKREYAEIQLAFWWRCVRVKHLKRTVLRELIVAKKAVKVLEVREGKSRGEREIFLSKSRKPTFPIDRGA